MKVKRWAFTVAIIILFGANGLPDAQAATLPPKKVYLPVIMNPVPSAVLLAAGDIAGCNKEQDEATAALIVGMPGTVAALGDNAYESGTDLEYATCYSPSWGQFKDRTKPTPGNHDYLTIGATGYYNYFGATAGDPTQGYYSYDLGTWHIVVLNSNCTDVGGCKPGGPQETWLRADLAAHPAQCTLAYWHHPLYSSGQDGSFAAVGPLWQALYDAGADVVLSGHDHDYERFAPQDPLGNLDEASGIVQFVAGTGGSNNTPWTIVQPNSLVRQNTTFGVLKLTLHAASYDWQFIPVSGSFTDTGTASCH